MAAQVSTVPRHGLVLDRPVTNESGKRDGDPREAASAAPGHAPSGPGTARPIPFPKRSNFQNLTGRRFGEWRVIDYAGSGRGRPAWKCLCSCGSTREVLSVHLSSGYSRSCGCLAGKHVADTRAANAARVDTLLELAAAAELYVRKCPVCLGTGTTKEYFDVFHLVAGERLQMVPCVRATRRDPCPSCSDLRRAIASAQGIEA
jgi:hypothetical protein